MGYDAVWGVYGGAEVGAWHLRERIWILAADRGQERVPGDFESSVPRFTGVPWREDVRRIEDLRDRPDVPPSLVRGVRNGVADYVDRISAIGNGQIPVVAVLAWRVLMERL